MSQNNKRNSGVGARSAQTDRARSGGHEGASAVEVRTAHDDHSMQEAMIGTDRRGTRSNTAWGAIFAGVVTFLALTILLSIATAAMGLQGASSTAAGIWSVIALAIALAVAGYVAGALAVRAGLLHGFLTWATSMLAILVLAGWLGTGLLGAVGNVAGTVAQTVAQSASVTGQDAQDAADAAQENVSQEDVDKAQQQAEQAAEDAKKAVNESKDEVAEGAWWAFAGSLLGALIAAGAGLAGARSVINRKEEAVVERTALGRR